jgi:DnaJ-class molecular chaperone
MAERDLYGTLGVSKDAAPDVIKKAYRKLAKELHPDRNPGNKKSEERFKDVAYAYDVLSDPKTRALFDEFGEAGLREGFDPDAARQMQAYQRAAGSGRGRPGGWEDIFSAAGGGGGQGGFSFDLEDLLGGRGGGRRGRRPSKGSDLESAVTVSLGDALRGTEQALTFRMPGSDEPTTVRARIPAGVADGNKVRLRGQGAPGSGGGPAGDIVLTVHVAPHEFFRREGDDLHVELPITLGEAFRGAKVRVPTLEGDVQLRVPPRTQGGAKLRLRGKGAPARGGARGDLYAHVQIRLPEGALPDVEGAIDALEAGYVDDVRGKLVL